MKKKILFICLVLFSIFSLLVTAACGGNNQGNKEENPETNVGTEVPTTPGEEEKKPITKETLEALVFVDGIFDYDGELHSIEVADVPEGVTVSYHNNNRSKPGQYKITATLTYEGITVKKTAMLIINHKESVLTADLNQTVLIYGNSSLLPIIKEKILHFLDTVEKYENNPKGIGTIGQ